MTELNASIPIIDFAPFIEGSTEARREVAAQMRAASSQWGFFYLINCGMPQASVEQAFRVSKAFFALPEEVKQSVAWQSAQSNRGYVGMRRERLDPAKPGDLKEAFNAAPESCDNSVATNLWPAGQSTFRDGVEAFMSDCIATADRIMEAFAISLDQPDGFFARAHDRHHHTLRLLHYPPLPESFVAEEGQSRAGAHTDYGSITLLFQDDAGGLEVRTRQGEWVQATPVPGAVVINTGDLMHRWTNHIFCSTPHRVNVPKAAMHRDRYSIAFFCHPNKDATIECIDSCFDANNPPRYSPISAGDHLLQRLNDTY